MIFLKESFISIENQSALGPNASNLFKSILFADDSSFSISNTNYNTMVNTLNLDIYLDMNDR